MPYELDSRLRGETGQQLIKMALQTIIATLGDAATQLQCMLLWVATSLGTAKATLAHFNLDQ